MVTEEKKILILTSSTGGGHDSAAAALREALEGTGVQCEVRDFLDFTSKAKKAILSKGHVFLYRHAPKVFTLGYKLQEIFPENIYAENALYAHPIQRYVRNCGFDVVIGVHIYPVLMLTAARKKYGFHVPTYYIATDYTCAPGVGQMKAEKLFVPPECREEFEKAFGEKEVPCIEETGIPVAKAFRKPIEKEEARKRLGLSPERKLVLVSAGSMGCGPLKKISLTLAGVRPDITVAVFTGNNKKLLREMKNKKHQLPNLLPLGFTKKMPLWMHAGDLMISKPGGLTSTEAATAGLPLLLFDEVPGLETCNLTYFVKRGCAAREKTVDGLVRSASLLLDHEEELAGIRRRQKRLFTGDAAEKITSLLF